MAQSGHTQAVGGFLNEEEPSCGTMCTGAILWVHIHPALVVWGYSAETTDKRLFPILVRQ